MRSTALGLSMALLAGVALGACGNEPEPLGPVDPSFDRTTESTNTDDDTSIVPGAPVSPPLTAPPPGAPGSLPGEIPEVMPDGLEEPVTPGDRVPDGMNDPVVTPTDPVDPSTPQ